MSLFSGLKLLNLSRTDTFSLRTGKRTGIELSVGLSSRGQKTMARFNEVRGRAKAMANKTFGAIKTGLSGLDPSNFSYHADNLIYHLRGHNTLRYSLKRDNEIRALIAQRREAKQVEAAKTSMQNLPGPQFEE